MSVRRGRNGKGWTVNWRENGRQRQATFTVKKDAERIDREIERRLEAAPFGVEVEIASTTLAELRSTWRAGYAETQLERHTRDDYDGAWRRHLKDRIGSLDVRALTAARCAEFANELTLAGVGEASQSKVLAHLSGLLRFAVLQGKLEHHPMRGAVKIPQPRRTRRCEPPGPEQVWRLVDRLRARGDAQGAILTLVCGFAGLRPQEALALEWPNIGKRTLRVERAIAFGERKTTKTGRMRSVTLFAAVEQELVGYRLEEGLPARGLLLAEEDGRPWSDTRYRNWRRRDFTPAAAAIGWFDAVPKDLRHSFASLLLWEGRDVLSVAAELGHLPTMTLDTYGHVIRELQGTRRVKAQTAITRARKVTLASAGGHTVATDAEEATPE